MAECRCGGTLEYMLLLQLLMLLLGSYLRPLHEDTRQMYGFSSKHLVWLVPRLKLKGRPLVMKEYFPPELN